METRKLVTATIFGVVIAAVKAPFTFPVTDYLIIVEVPILALSFLLLGKGGATYTGLVNGVLQSVVKTSFFPLDLIFGVSFGVLVDIFGTVLHVRSADRTDTKAMIAALGLASTVLGLGITFIFLTLNLPLGIDLSGYSTIGLVEVIYAPIVIWGILSGILGGYLSARIWERNLKVRFKSLQPPVG